MNTTKIVALLFSIFMLNACSLDTEPTYQIKDEFVYNNLPMLNAVLQSTYSKLKNERPNDGMIQWALCPKVLSISYGADINADPNMPFGNTQPFRHASYYNPLSYLPNEQVSRGFWKMLYSVIYNANTIIENIDQVEGDQTLKNEIKGQALVMRGKCYFDLIRFFQHTYILAKDKPGVPLVLNNTINQNNPRVSVEEVYKQILKDFKEAETLLAGYVRPSKAYYDLDVLNFYLANVYLTMENWQEAESYAKKLRTKYPLMTIEQYKDGFTTMNEEWILGYEQTEEDYTNDNMSAYFNYGQMENLSIMRTLYPANHFVEMMGDDPRALFIPHPSKDNKFACVKFMDGNVVPFGDMLDLRAAEMYLVEAEAAARQGKVKEAKDLLNAIQQARPGAKITSAESKEELIKDILLERRKEMYGEGLDYFDIKRLQLPVDKKISKGHELDIYIPANSNKLVIMIPDNEIENNKGIEQNPNPSVEPDFKP